MSTRYRLSTHRLVGIDSCGETFVVWQREKILNAGESCLHPWINRWARKREVIPRWSRKRDRQDFIFFCWCHLCHLYETDVCREDSFIEKTARLRARWYQLGFGDSKDVIKNSMYIDSLTDTGPCMHDVLDITLYFGWLDLVTSQTDAKADDAMNQLCSQFHTVDGTRPFVCSYLSMNRNTNDLNHEKRSANLDWEVFVTLARVDDSPASSVGESNKFICWWILAL